MGAKPPATRRPAPGQAEPDGFVPGVQPAGGATAEAAEPPLAARPSFLAARASATLRAIRSNPTGRIAFKAFVGLAGALVVAIGLVLIPLPGPGWALVILGLAIWAIEFAWAKHLLRFTKDKVRGWTRWVGRRSWPVRLLLGAIGLVFIAAVLVLSLKFSFGINVIADLWAYVTTH